jgi:hypothetical protein
MDLREINSNYVMEVLNNNGINDDYFEEMGGKEVENGGDEWMDALSDIIDKDAYEVSMEGDFTEEDNKKIIKFVNIMEMMGIEFV